MAKAVTGVLLIEGVFGAHAFGVPILLSKKTSGLRTGFEALLSPMLVQYVMIMVEGVYEDLPLSLCA